MVIGKQERERISRGGAPSAPFQFLLVSGRRIPTPLLLARRDERYGRAALLERQEFRAGREPISCTKSRNALTFAGGRWRDG